MILLALCLILLPNSFLTRFTNFTPVFSPITLLPLFVRLIPPPFTPRPPCFSSFTPVTIDDVSSLLSQSPDTNCDLDPIPTSLLKQFSHVLLPTITNIINLSISTGVFPDHFKSCSSCSSSPQKKLTWTKRISVVTVLYLIFLSYLKLLNEWSSCVLLMFFHVPVQCAF